jgi:hypothetical protein
MLSAVPTMKRFRFSLLLFFLSASMAEAAGVSLERLEDFNPQTQKLFVNVEVEVNRDCLVDPAILTETFTGLLAVFGFQTGTVDESRLEFAVSVKGLQGGSCGLRQMSMVRQIPDIKMLRIPPGSTSTRYRLWMADNFVSGTKTDIQTQLQEQARRDVVAFTRALNR